MELALDLSYQSLSPDVRRLLRLVALHPGQDLDAYAAAALTDGDLRTTRTRLRHLCRDHLMQHGTPGRYTMHDLVRAYAVGRAGDEDPPPDRFAALTRLFDFYLAAAVAAVDTLHPDGAHRRPRVPEAGTPVPALTGRDSARAWLDTERPTLVAVAGHTAAHGWLAHTTRLALTLYPYLSSGYLTDALAVHGHARNAAHQTGDPTEQARALLSVGITEMQVGRHGPASDHLQQALALFRHAADRSGEAFVRTNLGVLEAKLGRNRPAAEHYAQSVALFRQTGHVGGEAHALNTLGGIEGKLGRDRPATEHLELSLTLFRQLGHRTGEAWTLSTLGHVQTRLGRHEMASGHLQQALTMYRQLDNRLGQAWTLDNLGTLHTRLGQPTVHHEQALAIFVEDGDRFGEASALNGLGEAAHAAGDAAHALARHTEAHTIAVDVGDRDQQARAHTGLGHAHLSLGDPDRAREHYLQAVALYTDLGMPDADQIRATLAAVEVDH